MIGGLARRPSPRSREPSIVTNEAVCETAVDDREPRAADAALCRSHTRSVRLPAPNEEAALPVAQLIRMWVCSRTLSTVDVNELGRRTGQSERLRTITSHRLFLSMIAGLAGGQVGSLADRLREFNHHK